MANIEKITPAQAVARIVEAPSILEDKGKSVFGWEVRSPMQAALNHLEEAIGALQGVSGAERQLAKAHSTYGDLVVNYTELRDPRYVAMQEYDKAIAILEKISDYDGISELVKKKLLLKQAGK